MSKVNVEVIVKTKKWGNSLGIILPASTVKQHKLKPGEEIIINIKQRNNVLAELFGSLKFSKPTEVILKEVRKDLNSKWL